LKKILKFLGLGLLLAVAIAAAAALFFQLSGIPSYPTERVDLTIEVTPERVARGRQITSLLCAGCHLDTTTNRLAGRLMPDVPPQFGTAYSRNITRHPTNGIGSWTDGELAYLLRTGVARDGRYTPPWMVKLPHASDEDIAAIIAFLRSDDPLVQASAAANRESQPAFLTKLLTRVAWKPFDYPRQPIPDPDPNDRVARGKYLAVGLLDCYSCHSADFATNDYRNPEKSKGFMAGGNTMVDANQREIRTSNITFDRETGIGAWTEDQFVRAIKGGFRPDNTPLVYPMQPMVELSDDDVRAIYAYLRTVPPVRNAVPRPARVAVAADAPDGKKIYFKYSCQSCHGETGVGLCDLRANLAAYSTDEALVTFIRNPAATHPGSKMPAWDGVIEEAEYLPLVRYLRTLSAAPGAAAPKSASS
jgi:mono/diheme cytochrome c family protein